MALKMILALLAVAYPAMSGADAIYTKNTPVLQVNSKNYDSLIAQSNHTSVGIAASGPLNKANILSDCRVRSLT